MGGLTAVGTLGSLAGTLLIGYLLIPLFPNSVTMYATAGGLMLAAMGYFVVWGPGDKATIPILLALGVGLPLGFLGVVKDRQMQLLGGSRTVFRGNSNFGELWVIDHPKAPLRACASTI